MRAVGAHHVEHVMGMPVSIDIRDDFTSRAPGSAETAISELVHWLHLVNETWSTWRDDSLISRYARGEVSNEDLPASMHRILDRCENLSIDTGGAFDIHIPAPNGTMLEPSGFIKGWAVQVASDLLAVHGVENFCINAGGDVVVRGQQATGAWRVGIRHPREIDALCAVLELAGPWAVATSGLYERGRHLIDPRTQRPATGLQSVTIVGHDLAEVDVAATAVFVMGLPGLDWAADRGLEAMLIDLDDNVHQTKGFAQLLVA
jgi:FAD:protein FMN transferase